MPWQYKHVQHLIWGNKVIESVLGGRGRASAHTAAPHINANRPRHVFWTRFICFFSPTCCSVQHLCTHTVGELQNTDTHACWCSKLPLGVHVRVNDACMYAQIAYLGMHLLICSAYFIICTIPMIVQSTERCMAEIWLCSLVEWQVRNVGFSIPFIMESMIVLTVRNAWQLSLRSQGRASCVCEELCSCGVVVSRFW